MTSDSADLAALLSAINNNEKREKIPEIFECEECGKTFKHRISLVGHQGHHKFGRDAVKFNCEYCDAMLSSQDDLTIHKATNHINDLKNELPVPCEYCNKRYKNMYRAEAHMKTHIEQIKRFQEEDGSYKCEQCGELYKKSDLFYRHINSHDGYRMFVCDQCGSRFQTEETLRTHKRLHTNKKMFKCTECGVEFHRKINLERHAAVHIRQKMIEEAVDGIFKCRFCVKVVFRSDKLQEHETKHTDPRNHFCCICGFVFKDKTQMCIHESKHITTTGKIKCLSTSKCFDTIEDLTEYYCTNLGTNRKFKCKVCMAEFNKLLLLKEHQLTHDSQELIDAERKEGELDPEYEARLFECDDCGKRFKRNCHLKVHKTVHEREFEIQDRQNELIGSLTNYTKSAKSKLPAKQGNQEDQVTVTSSADTSIEPRPSDLFSKMFFSKMAEDMKRVKEQITTIPEALEANLEEAAEEAKSATSSETSSLSTESSRKRPHNDLRSSCLVALVKEKVSKILEKTCVAPVVSTNPLEGYPLEGYNHVKPHVQPVIQEHEMHELKQEMNEPKESSNILLQEAEAEVEDYKTDFVRIDEQEPATSEIVEDEPRIKYVSSSIESVMEDVSGIDDQVIIIWTNTFESSLYTALLEDEHKQCIVVMSQKSFNTKDFPLKKQAQKSMQMKMLRPNFYVTASRILSFGDLELPKPSLVGVSHEDLEKAFINMYGAQGLNVVHLVDYEPEDENFALLLATLASKMIVCNFKLQEELHMKESQVLLKEELIQPMEVGE